MWLRTLKRRIISRQAWKYVYIHTLLCTADLPTAAIEHVWWHQDSPLFSSHLKTSQLSCLLPSSQQILFQLSIVIGRVCEIASVIPALIEQSPCLFSPSHERQCKWLWLTLMQDSQNCDLSILVTGSPDVMSRINIYFILYFRFSTKHVQLGKWQKSVGREGSWDSLGKGSRTTAPGRLGPPTAPHPRVVFMATRSGPGFRFSAIFHPMISWSSVVVVGIMHDLTYDLCCVLLDHAIFINAATVTAFPSLPRLDWRFLVWIQARLLREIGEVEHLVDALFPKMIICIMILIVPHCFLCKTQ